MTRSYGRYLIRSRHGTTYQFRLSIPPELRLHFGGRRELRRSLRTVDRRDASRQAIALRAWCECIFRALREDVLAKKKTSDQSSMVGYQMFMDSLGRENVVDHPNDPDRESREIHELRKQDNEFVLANPDLVMKFRAPSARGRHATAIAFQQVADEYLTDYAKRGAGQRKKAPRQGTLNAETTLINFWKSYFKETPIQSISTVELRSAQALLANLPANRAQHRLSDAEAIALAATDHSYQPLADHNTVPKYASRLRNIFAYAKKMRYIDDDPSDVLDVSQDKSVGKDAEPFSLADVSKIFTGKDYIGKLQVKRTTSSFRLLPAQFWMPLLAAFSGARAEELAQLTVADLMQDEQTRIDYLYINDEGLAGDGRKKSIKSISSKRRLPVHSILKTIGFMEFVEARSAADGGQAGLFDLTRSTDEGRLAKAVTQWFSRSDAKSSFLRRCGIDSHGRDTDGRIEWSKTFHSWRHTVRDVLRQQPHPIHGGAITEFEMDLVTGHAPVGSAGVDYGSGKRPLDLVSKLVECIRYDGVPFDQIKWNS